MALAVAQRVSRPVAARVGRTQPRALPVLRRSPVQQRSVVVVRADSSSQGSAEIDTEKLMKDLQAKWDAVDNKPQAVLLVVGGILGLWLGGSVLGTLNKIPLIPKLFEFIGLGYSAWFTYRYLLFKSTREELIKDVDELKKKISGN